MRPGELMGGFGLARMDCQDHASWRCPREVKWFVGGPVDGVGL
jgi:hypothetical protein